LHPSIGRYLTELRGVIGSLDAFDQIPQIEVAIGSENTALILRHLIPLMDADRSRLNDFQNKMKIAVFLQSGGPETVAALNEQTNNELCYHLDEFGLDIHFRPDDFTQVNFDINKAMIRLVMDLLALQSSDMVLDLFCGLGNFSLPMAGRCGFVTGIEISEQLVLRARKNAIGNRIDNIEFHNHDLMQEELGLSVLKESFNKILIDPPRNGAKEILGHLCFDNVEKLAYVSCNPATLARDAGILVREKGLVLKQAGVLDMFPQTSHVESVALFEHK